MAGGLAGSDLEELGSAVADVHDVEVRVDQHTRRRVPLDQLVMELAGGHALRRSNRGAR